MKTPIRLSPVAKTLSRVLYTPDIYEPCQSIETNWIVLTGAPGSGKTSISQSLHSYGFSIIPEMSRIVIEDALEKGFSIQEIMQNPELLTNSILARNYYRATNLSPDELFIWDTGLLDSAAFYNVAGIDYQCRLGFLNAYRYKSVIFLEMLPQDVLGKDQARPQDVVLRNRIDKALRSIYSQLGYSLAIVPISEIESRTKQVVKIINQHLYT